jgi:hypothetical protein
VRPLAAHRQVLAMTQAPIRSHINVTLDIHRHITPQITLDLVLLIQDLTDFDDVLVREIVAFQVKDDAGLFKDFSRSTPADAINVGERNFHPFVSWEIDSGDAGHIFFSFLIPWAQAT